MSAVTRAAVLIAISKSLRRCRLGAPSKVFHFISQDFKVLAQYPSYTPLITPLESLVPRQDYEDFRSLLKDLLSNKSR